MKRKYLKYSLLVYIIAVFGSLASDAAFSQSVSERYLQKLKQDTKNRVTNKITPIIDRYCGNACQIIDTRVLVEEIIEGSEEIGFESSTDHTAHSDFDVTEVHVSIQVDQRVTQKNRNNLDKIISNHLRNFSERIVVDWIPIEVPQIGSMESELDSLKQIVQRQIRKTIGNVISMYCPEGCILSNILINGHYVTPDEADKLSSSEVIHSKTSNSSMAIDSVVVDISIDSAFSDQARNRIINLMRIKTKKYGQVQLNVESSNFPETYSSIQSRLAAESDDPYGLEKLRQMLTLFRDLAGTKEIISTSEKDSTSSKDFSTSSEGEETPWFRYLLILLVVASALLFILLKWANAKKDANLMIRQEGAAQQNGRSGNQSISHIYKDETGQNNQHGGQSPDLKNMRLKMEVQSLQDELSQIFVEAPLVAKETFSRILQKDGVEETAKYVHIFGKLIVFELLDDPALGRRLYELSEYYHKSDFDFDLEEKLKLLLSLKKQVIANEIIVLTRRGAEEFNFLARLDPEQLFRLISDENAQVQGVVIAQIPPEKRRRVFDLFVGEPRIKLLSQLSKADAIPKEYLQNIAKVLQKKVMSKPEFDTQNLRSSDILLDLLEKSNLDEQKKLMTNLILSNPDAARAIKMKLVTIDMLPYLKDGHLLELVLGLGQDDLITFLAGTKEHIQHLLLSHAPQELAESWIEMLEAKVGVDDDAYRIVERMILAKVRNLASNGAFSILDVNDMIFGTGQDIKDSTNTHEPERDLVRADQIVA